MCTGRPGHPSRYSPNDTLGLPDGEPSTRTLDATVAASNWVARARDLAPVFAARAARHDADDAFVADNYSDLETSGFLEAGVPSDLGGGGAAQLAVQDMVARTAEYAFPVTHACASAQFSCKTVAANACLATVEKAMEIVGGTSFFRSSELERLLRDVHAAQFHPLKEKRQLLMTGRVALGLDPVA
jgi:alkylation response protein AidB-like acyl-CoA dehydrogenase